MRRGHARARRRGGGAKAMSAGEARQQRNEDVDDVDPERAPPIPPPGDVRRLATGDVSRVRTDTETLPEWPQAPMGIRTTGVQDEGRPAGRWSLVPLPRHHRGCPLPSPRKILVGVLQPQSGGYLYRCGAAVPRGIGLDQRVQHLVGTLGRGLRRHPGKAPRFVTADKGFAVRAVYEAHGTHRVASVFPPRETSFYRQDSHIDTHDHFGIPTCPGAVTPATSSTFAPRSTRTIATSAR